MGEYQDYYKRYNVFPLRNLYNAFIKTSKPSPSQSVGAVSSGENKDRKTIHLPVNREVTATETRIYPFRTVDALIEEYGDKGNLVRLNKCMCRLTREAQGRECVLNMPVEASCITFGEDARYWVDYGHGEVISKDEALSQIRLSRDRGAIHSVFHERDNAELDQVGICTCCWDCCGLFSGYNSGAGGLSFRCFFYASVSNPAACQGCGVCEKYCPTAALSVRDKKLKINWEKCIGCGQCAHQCPVAGVIEMIPQDRNVALPMLKKSEARL